MDHHLFAAVRPISRFHTEFRGSRDTDEQYLRRRGSDQHSGDHRNGSEKNKADEKQDHIMDQNPDAHSHYLSLCLITHCCFTLSAVSCFAFVQGIPAFGPSSPSSPPGL